MASLLWNESDWNFELLTTVWSEIELIAKDELHLSYNHPQLEIINTTQMLELYTSVGMPLYYQHWSFGKQFVREQESYKTGRSGLAYEIVINSSPVIAYLMEDNTMTMQALVMAHAIAGHGHFFKNNYLFKQWTDASSIIDYLSFAKNYIREQEDKHGVKAVEDWLDSCHALMNYGVNRYKRPAKLSMEKEQKRQKEREDFLQSQVNELYKIIPKSKKNESKQIKFPSQPEENLLYFFEKYSPDIETWQREIIRIVRKMSQYFYPQGQTTVLNEGFASLTHYTILNRLHEKGLMSDGSQLEFLSSHSNVLFQPDFDSKYYSKINPYAFGFAMLKDIQRMCKNPTIEDLRLFPTIKNANSWDIILESIAEYRDESFIRQWLSPKVIRDFKLFSLHDNKQDIEKYEVSAIHNEKGYEEIREKLADQYLRGAMVPHLEVINVDRKSRTLYIQYTEHKGRKLDNVHKMLPHLIKLWGGYSVVITECNTAQPIAYGP